MTATTPTPKPAPPPTPSRRTGSAPLLTLAEVALGAVTVAAVLGLGRLFADGSFLLPVLTVTVAAHAAASWCRRRGLGILLTVPVAVVGLVLVVSWLQLPETTAFGLPTSATLAEAGSRLSSALVTFREVVAPAPVEPGFVLAASIGVWVIAFVADTAAFRAGATVEAAVPGATLFVFGAALAAPTHRVTTTAVFLVGLLAYWLAQRALVNARSSTWLALDTAAGSRALLRSGAALGALVIVAAVVGGPLLPGAEASGLIPWRASERDESSRVTISPLVDIRARLVDQARSVVFTVTSPERSYWRLTSLETFDGRIWSSNRSYEDVDGELEAGTRLEPAAETRVTQEFEIGALSSIWLPAAYRPVGVDGTDASYDPDSASLIVPEDMETTQEGLRYTIESVLPRLTSEELAAVPAVAPEAIADGYTDLPEGFSPSVRELALEVTAGQPSQYAKARALQDHFRDGSFRYDLNVERGHDGDALERFLFDTRTGYCEQFAGAFAAMARAAGLPARVAVGFTPGEQDADGRFVVRGANGHAWPEVYLDGYGWVPFEPTPGRGIPGASAYTGLPDEQAAVTDPSTATTLPQTSLSVPLVPPQGAPTDVPNLSLEGFVPEGGAATPAPSPWPDRLRRAGLVAVGLPAAWVVLLGVARTARCWHRRAGAGSPEARVTVAWAEVGDALASAGHGPRACETPGEVAERAASVPGVDPRLLGDLAAAATTAAYDPGGVDPEAAGAARSAATTLTRGVRRSLGRRERLRAAVDPRPLLPATWSMRRIDAGHVREAPVLHRAR